jgi:hypothetical protein
MTEMTSPTTPAQRIAMMPFMPNWQVCQLAADIDHEYDRLTAMMQSHSDPRGVPWSLHSDMDDVLTARVSIKAEMRLRGMLQPDDSLLAIFTASRASGGRPVPAVRA